MGENRKKYKSEEIIKGFREHDKKVLEFVYKEYSYLIKVFINSKSGSDEDAWDIFQEAMGVVYDLSLRKKPKLQLTSSFKTFFFSICDNIWLKKLRMRRLEMKHDGINVEDVAAEFFELEYIIDSNMLFSIYYKHLNMLDPDCKKLLNLIINKEASNDVANQVNLGSAQAVYNKKRNCIRKLIELIQLDPEYKNLTDYETPRKN